jgi:hypothetical protein
MESTFMERKTPGGVKNTSAPGQYPPPSVRRTRRDNLDWDSSSDERDRSYMQNVHIRDSDIRAGYAFPREPNLYHTFYSVVYACMYNFYRTRFLHWAAFVYFCLKSIMSNKTQTKFKFVGGTGLTTYF